MMITSAIHYHRKTCYDRHRMTGHFLDWKNQPLQFKEYPAVTVIPLPGHDRHGARRDIPSLINNDLDPVHRMDLNTLSSILHLANGLTGRARYPDGDHFYRSAASAGALYPTEIYLGIRGLETLDDGLYHFTLRRHGLSRLRRGDISSSTKDILTGQDYGPAALTFFLTAIFFRSAWKYRERAYRYSLLDTGHVLENLILAAKAHGLETRVFYDFDDILADQLLGLDRTREVTLAVVQVITDSEGPVRAGRPLQDLPETIRQASRVARKEIAYPVMGEIHAAGEARRTPGGAAPCHPDDLGVTVGEWVSWDSPADSPQSIPFPLALLKRRSKRNFISGPLSEDKLAVLLEAFCTLDIPGNRVEPAGRSTPCIGFLVSGIQGWEPGFYLKKQGEKAFGLAVSGRLLEPMARICLDQGWLANAALHFLYLQDLAGVENAWGPRGYRHVMLEAGRSGQRIYLLSTALGVGCCGIGAFYDQEAADLLGLKETAGLLYLVAVGNVKRI